MAGKYAALEQYLSNLPASQRSDILTFQEIEQILNKKLPHSAYTYLKWWTYEKQPRSPQTQTFIRAGWRRCGADPSRFACRSAATSAGVASALSWWRPCSTLGLPIVTDTEEAPL